MIPANELPLGGFVPGKALTPLTAEDMAGLEPDAIARHEKMSKLIESLPRDQSSEWYFSKLMEDETIKEMEGERKENEAAFKEMIEKILNGDGDDHNGWGDGNDDVSEEDRQLALGEIRGAADRSTGCGNLIWALLNTREFLFIQ